MPFVFRVTSFFQFMKDSFFPSILKISDIWPALISQIIGSTFSLASAGSMGIISTASFINYIMVQACTVSGVLLVSKKLAEYDPQGAKRWFKIILIEALILPSILGLILRLKSEDINLSLIHI